MNILVTGAAGFIGSHVCEHFIKSGNLVVGIDNFDNFYPKKIKQANIAGIIDNDNFRFYEADIRDNKALNDIFSANKIEGVIHLAAKAGVRPSISAISDYYDVNVNGTINLLEVMRMNSVNKMIFASSSSVYGNNIKVPFSEDDFVDNPISPYASTKKSGELLCHVYFHLYGMNITCLRFFTVFGPRQRPDLAIHKFTKLMEEGKPIPFFGDGTSARDYTYILDILNGIECAFSKLDGYNIFNLGESRLTNLNTLVQMLEKASGRKAILDKQPSQPGDVNVTYADISKARSVIGYNPAYDMTGGINEFIKWYLANKKFLKD
ncbi:MAG: SDR family NAD(P)-dependent oxidoreductase [Bacteroidales bacterium]